MINIIIKTSGETRGNKTMIVEIKEGDTVYCENISRLVRSLKDLIEIIEQLVNKGARVVIVKEEIDTISSTYKLLLAIFSV